MEIIIAQYVPFVGRVVVSTCYLLIAWRLGIAVTALRTSTNIGQARLVLGLVPDIYLGM